MIWQDWLFMAGNIIFIAALVPAVLSKEKPPIKTSLMTGATVAAFCVGFATLGLWFSAVAQAIVSALWLSLAAQKWRRK